MAIDPSMQISRLHANLRLLARKPPATETELARMRAHFRDVPSEYAELVNDATELELDFDHPRSAEYARRAKANSPAQR